MGHKDKHYDQDESDDLKINTTEKTEWVEALAIEHRHPELILLWLEEMQIRGVLEEYEVNIILIDLGVKSKP